MPDTTTPGPDDHLGAPPPPPPVHYAEQALLGALLLEPRRLSEVTGITSASFSHPTHGALFTAIGAVPAPDPDQHARGTAWLNAVYAAARKYDRALTPSHLHTLIQACPRPRHAPAYARMIEAEHARRLLHTAAQHLVRTARDGSLPHPVQATLAAADTLASVVDDLAARFPQRSGPVPRTPPPQPGPHERQGRNQEAVEEERLLLATATAHPEDIERMRWLSADDFTHPLHAGLWRCLTDLAGRRADVDTITVLWQAQRSGFLHPGTQPAGILQLLSEPAGSTGHWGRRVLERSLLDTAHQTGLRVASLTDDPSLAPYPLVTGSRRALAALSAIRTRWQHATAPAPPTHRPRASAVGPSRAGPPTTSPAAPDTRPRASR